MNKRYLANVMYGCDIKFSKVQDQAETQSI